MKYRSRTDIIADMLEVGQGDALKTNIMYRVFLSFPQLKEYRELLTDSGLLEYSKEGRKYRTTEKEQHFLKLYTKVGKAIAPKAR